jgi:penicillin-binding protein 2
VGCKTGTAEKTLGNPHAWFTAFAPFDNPKLSVTVIIEDGGEGSGVAAPAAREILDWWFANKVQS